MQNRCLQEHFQTFPNMTSSFWDIHPIWWGKLPPVVNSFLSAANLSGKEVAHFCTHAGSGFGTSDRELRAQAPNAQFLESLSVVGTEVDHAKVQIENWVRRVLNR